MNFSKLGSRTWSEPGIIPSATDAVTTFVNQIKELKFDNSEEELLANSIKSKDRLFLASDPKKKTNSLKNATSLPALHATNTGTTARENINSTKKRVPVSALRRPPPGVSYSIQERPPNRVEIQSLEMELEERLKIVLEQEITDFHAVESGDLFQPHKDAILIIRDNILRDFDVPFDRLDEEPWLDEMVKSGCIRGSCDEVASKLNDMVGVSSSELGNVFRKLRSAYHQSFEQIYGSWRKLREACILYENDLAAHRDESVQLRHDLNCKELEIQSVIDEEVAKVRASFESDRAADRDNVTQMQHKCEQMSETLRSLNGIFKAMHADGSAAKTSDLQAKCYKLEAENVDLRSKTHQLDKLKVEVASYDDRIHTLQLEAKHRNLTLETLQREMVRREELVSTLLEKDAARDAEIEKMKQIAGIKKKEEEDDDNLIEFKEPPTSVLCIKCKKSLDDLSNIRAAVMGPGLGAGKKMQCEAFRMLLPNLRGRRPARSQAWLRTCMRAMLMSKLREDVSLLHIKGDLARFPHFVYSWFDRDTTGLAGPALSAVLLQADEDRWGLYYGVKSLAKDDPEAQVFWGLLDEAFGEDGQQFVFYCLSMVLSIGGSDLWSQFGRAAFSGNNITAVMNAAAATATANANTTVKPPSTGKPSTANTASSSSAAAAAVLSIGRIVWLDVHCGTDAAKLILVRALKTQLRDALNSIEYLKTVPEFDDILNSSGIGDDDGDRSVRSNKDTLSMGKDSDHKGSAAHSAASLSAAAPHNKHGDPTHIDLFMWLRVMQQQLQIEQIHRGAAVRLMFESSAIGVLTYGSSSSLPGGGSGDNSSSNSLQVEYPQFQSICRTLFPNLSSTECASLYNQCFDEGQRSVNAEVFTRVANTRGLFSRYMRLTALPLLNRQMKIVRAQENGGSGGGSGLIALPTTIPTTAGTTTAAAASVTTAHTPTQNQASVEQQQRDTDAVQRLKELQSIEKEKVQMQLRWKLGSLVHRRMAAMLPQLKHLMTSVPDRWKVVLKDGIEDVKQSLLASKALVIPKTKIGLNDANPALLLAAQNQPSGFQIDGLQPFIHYRRLLALALLIRSLTDNPLVPTELFSLSQGEGAQGGGGVSYASHASSLDGLDFDILQVDHLLSSLEDGLELGSTMGLTFESQSRTRFQTARISIIVRRLQYVVKRFVNVDVPAPRSVRNCLQPGYLRGSGQNLRTREVLSEPWWGQAGIAEVYSFKIAYDMKAVKLGLPPIQLPEALTAFNYLRWGSLTVADRASHDLCFCAKSYSNGLPRFRLFCAFLGAGAELEDPSAASILQTPHAVSLYLNLLVEIHREIAATKTWRGMQHQAATKKKQLHNNNGTAAAATVAAGEGVSADGGDSNEQLVVDAAATTGTGGGVSGSTLTAQQQEAEMFAFATPLVLSHIETLFPATETAFTRADRREVWSLDVQLLIRATSRWCLSIKGMSTTTTGGGAGGGAGGSTGGSAGGATTAEAIDPAATSLFITLPQSLRTNTHGEADVDEYLWVMMLQWAKLTAWNVKRSLPRVVWAQKNNPIVHATTMHETFAVVAAPGTMTSDISLRTLAALAQQPTAPVFTLTRFPFTESFLRLLAQSIYRPGEGQFMADPSNYAAMYLNMVITRGKGSNTTHFQQGGGSRRGTGDHPSTTASTVLVDMFRSGVLWDVNTGGQEAGKEVDLSKAAIAIKGDSMPAHRLFSVRAIRFAVSIELSFYSAKKAYTSYNEVINATLTKISRKAKTIGDHAVDMDHIVTTTKKLLQQLLEKINSIEQAAAAYTGTTALAASSSSSSGSSSGGGGGGGGGGVDLEALGRERDSDRRAGDVQEVWQIIHMVMCLLSELVVMAGEEFPKDNWQSGRKVHVDRSHVYSIPLHATI